jgi:hypothetical protein
MVMKKIEEELAAAEALDYNGKRYVAVKDRIKIFRNHYPKHSILTEIKQYASRTGSPILILCTIMDEARNVVATGHAETTRGMGRVASDAPVEFTETKAIGRALACFGIGGGEYASAEEMLHVVSAGAPSLHEPGGDGALDLGTDMDQSSSSDQPRGIEGDVPGEELSEGRNRKFALREAAKAIVKALDFQETTEELETHWRLNRPLIDEINSALGEESFAELKRRFGERKQQLMETSNVNEL